MRFENAIGLGVAGNFANHLEQAGEVKDFLNVKTDEPNAPKGIFPFYLPNSESFLGIYSVCQEKIKLPEYEANAQVEPEIAVSFEIEYDENKNVKDLKAKAFTAFNDCTIRRDNATKISQKKSWGEHSKGIGDKWIDIDKFETGGIMDNYHLCSFVKRDGIMHPYGVDAPLLGYSYFYQKLTQWLIEKMNNQKDFGPLEDIASKLKNCNYPSEAVVSIGATAYTEFGEKNYLKKGDEIYVIVYNAKIDEPNLEPSKSKIILKQIVE